LQWVMRTLRLTAQKYIPKTPTVIYSKVLSDAGARLHQYYYKKCAPVTPDKRRRQVIINSPSIVKRSWCPRISILYICYDLILNTLGTSSVANPEPRWALRRSVQNVCSTKLAMRVSTALPLPALIRWLRGHKVGKPPLFLSLWLRPIYSIEAASTML
jgi:hypothetical protein